MVDCNDYEAKRRLCIERNKRKLEQLGLKKLALEVSLQSHKKRHQKECDLPVQAKPPKPLGAVPVRRSTRLRASRDRETPPKLKPEDDHGTNNTSAALPLEHKKTSRRLAAAPQRQSCIEAVYPFEDATSGGGPRRRVSCTQLELDLDAFHAQWLGKEILPKGKLTVMSGMCPSHTPVFSRMSGIQTWQNGVVLFVNLPERSDAESSQYANQFSQQGDVVFFRWFAQNRHRPDSRIIQWLQQCDQGDPSLGLHDLRAASKRGDDDAAGAGAAAAAGGSGSMDSTAQTAVMQPPVVLLFLRRLDGPYVYCGRLAYLGHDVTVRPIEFRWQLKDLNVADWHRVCVSAAFEALNPSPTIVKATV